MVDARYSTAPRCPRCDHRAILTFAVANRLVAASGNRLESFRCRNGRSWHVRHPDVEGGGRAERRRWRG
ncbi:MAG TPA: hypothetical protein VFO16_11550 [Pseudonocardiaceae bacterium]|nr:hypothetical protein [Pseudonocardiaceae bacterium]